MRASIRTILGALLLLGLVNACGNSSGPDRVTATNSPLLDVTSADFAYTPALSALVTRLAVTLK